MWGCVQRYATALLRMMCLTQRGWNTLLPGVKGTELPLHWRFYSFLLPAISRELHSLDIFMWGNLTSWNHPILMHSSLVPYAAFTKYMMQRAKILVKTLIWKMSPSSYSATRTPTIIMSINICILHIFGVTNCTYVTRFQA